MRTCDLEAVPGDTRIVLCYSSRTISWSSNHPQSHKNWPHLHPRMDEGKYHHIHYVRHDVLPSCKCLLANLSSCHFKTRIWENPFMHFDASQKVCLHFPRQCTVKRNSRQPFWGSWVRVCVVACHSLCHDRFQISAIWSEKERSTSHLMQYFSTVFREFEFIVLSYRKGESCWP